MYKNNCFKGLCLALAMVFAGFVAQAQHPETSFYFNGFLPTAEFNNASNVVDDLGVFSPMTRENVAKDASAGLGISARMGIWCDIGYGELLPFAEASFFWNSSNSKVRDIYDNNELNSEYNATPSAPHYFNVPLMLGLKYRYSVTPVVKPFVEFALGCDFMFISRNGYRGVSSQYYAYKPSGCFSWEIGGGTYLGENVSVGLYYYGLGDHRIDYTSRTKANVGDNNPNFDKRNIGEFALRFGFHF